MDSIDLPNLSTFQGLAMAYSRQAHAETNATRCALYRGVAILCDDLSKAEPCCGTNEDLASDLADFVNAIDKLTRNV